MRKLLAIVSILCFSLGLVGQVSPITYWNYIDPQTESSTIYKTLGFEKDELLITSSHNFDKAKEIEKCQQYYRGIPVFGTYYHFHYDHGRLVKSSGKAFPNLNIDLNFKLEKPQVEKIAIEQVKQYLQINKGIPNVDRIELKVDQVKSIVANTEAPRFNGDFVAAYEVVVHAVDDWPVHHTVILDANSGSTILDFTHVCSHNIPARGSGFYYKDVDIVVDSVSQDSFVLRDLERNIEVYNTPETPFLFSGEAPFYRNSNDWHFEDNDEVGNTVDAMYGSIGYYDFMLNQFNWKGVANTDTIPMIANVNGNAEAGTFFGNAFWNGVSTNYSSSDASCMGSAPFTTLSIIAHEFTHGFTDYTSDLIYAGESGGLNESMSDIFGESIEYYLDSANFSWRIGEEINNIPIRIMNDPNAVDDPKYYYGNHWYDFSVHNLSGVMNYWYYLLVEGEKGVNEVGDAYDIQGIGFEDALKIVFQLQTAYLGPSSNYPEARLFSIEATKDVFGDSSRYIETVRDAWDAVGVFDRADTFWLGAKFTDAFDRALPVCVDLENQSIQMSVDLYSLGKDFEEGTELVLSFHINDSLQLDHQFVLDQGLTNSRNRSFDFDIPASTEIFEGIFSNNEPLKVEFRILDQAEVLAKRLLSSGVQFINPDLEIHSVAQKCEEDGELEIMVRNNSCDWTWRESDLEIVLTDANEQSISYDEIIRFNTTLPNQSKRVSVELPENYVYPIKLELNTPIDELYVLNNSYIIDQPNTVLTIGDTIDFEDESSRLYFGDQIDMVNYDNSRWMSLYNPIEERMTSIFCQNNLLNSIDVFGEQRFCVDTRGIESPRLVYTISMLDSLNEYSFLAEDEALIFGIGYDNPSLDDIINVDRRYGEAFEMSMDLDFVGVREVEMFYNNFIRLKQIVEDSLSQRILIDNIWLEGASSSTQQLESEVSVYPNPASNTVYFDFDNYETMDVVIHDLYGKIVIEASNYYRNQPLMLRGLGSGVYFYQLSHEDQPLHAGKLIIQR